MNTQQNNRRILSGAVAQRLWDDSRAMYIHRADSNYRLTVSEFRAKVKRYGAMFRASAFERVAFKNPIKLRWCR